MKNGRVFWGLILVLGSILLILNNLGLFPNLNGFKVLLSIVFLATLIKSLLKLSITGTIFSLAFLWIIYDEYLGTNITSWAVILSALLASIGLNLLFGKRISIFNARKNCFKNKENLEFEDYKIIDVEDDNHVKFETNFGSSIKYVNTQQFVQGQFKCSFGAMKVYFDNTAMESERAIVDLDISFAGVEIYVPRNWKVVNNISTSFGAVEFKNGTDSVMTNTLVLIGNVSFSGVEIIYV